ncbi:iron-containing alcohol dehydrogenase [Photobacterium sp. CCB-ST2H9]|uniref:iron-containing alcohol dehydrogenase n=1 Tax=Photobacterium sp. CCB-ST2H9 TaxID=2912855 RepID=UPI00200419E3|nr:iron-containing alcohol dehydrogenase [Photobacterium sp. CCB-ST2H9]UTM60376.1 iron-containing alcohol dehydrogenase [Photobacterium sp. CCB-ST2H9]
MNPFSYHNPTRIHFGEGQIAKVGTEIPKDSKVLVLYGGGSIKKNGVYDQVSQALEGHQWDEFAGIEPNPQYDTLMAAVNKIQTEGFDYLLAVGGGSVIDGTKFIAAAARFEGADPWDILAKYAPVKDALPIGCILTLPATGSESNKGAVVSRGKDKLSFMTAKVQPAFAVLDPATTLSLSPRQVSNGVVDAFVHVMEQYLTFPVDAKVQDRFAEGLLLTLIEEGPKALASPEDMTVRANIMWSATQALNGLIGVGVPQDWTTHMIGHELTGNYGIDHARTLSIVLPAVMKEQRQEKEAKLLQYAERIFGLTEGSVDERIETAIANTESFFRDMQVPTRLSDVDLGEEDILVLINSLEKHGMTTLGEHGKISISDSEAILRTAL